MEQTADLPVTNRKSESVTIFKALLERQKLISNRLQKGGSIRELKQMGLQFGTVNLQNDLSARD